MNIGQKHRKGNLTRSIENSRKHAHNHVYNDYCTVFTWRWIWYCLLNHEGKLLQNVMPFLSQQRIS